MIKTALSCNAAWGKGGQGNFLRRATTGLSALSNLHLFCADSEIADTNLSFTVKTLSHSLWSQWLVQSIPLLRRRKDWIVLLSDTHFDRQVAKKLMSETYDLFIGVAGHSCLSFKEAKNKGSIVWLYCLNSYLPFMKQEIDCEIKMLGDSIKDMHPRMLRRFSEECRQADLILVNSEVAKQTFLKAGIASNKVVAIHPCIDSTRFHPTPKADEVFRVLCVGTIEPRKGVQYLIPGFIQAKIPNSELVIVGGTSTRNLSALIKNALMQHSNIKQEFWNVSSQDPTELFGRCSVLVQPSVEDGFGVVALEAMACGLPVIVTSNCGSADVVKNGINGFIVPPRSADAIAEKLIFLSENLPTRAQMGREARATAEINSQKRFSCDLRQIFMDRELEI